jgi:hypothetical protein
MHTSLFGGHWAAYFPSRSHDHRWCDANLMLMVMLDSSMTHSLHGSVTVMPSGMLQSIYSTLLVSLRDCGKPWESVNFLDLNLTIEGQRIVTRTYQKPARTFGSFKSLF